MKISENLILFKKCKSHVLKPSLLVYFFFLQWSYEKLKLSLLLNALAILVHFSCSVSKTFKEQILYLLSSILPKSQNFFQNSENFQGFFVRMVGIRWPLFQLFTSELHESITFPNHELNFFSTSGI